MSLNIGGWTLRESLWPPSIAPVCISISYTSQRRPLIPPQFSVPFLCLKSDNDKVGSWAGWLHIIFSEYVWHDEEIFINGTVVWGVWGPVLSWPDAKDLNSLETNIPTWTVRKQVCSVSLNGFAFQWACWCMTVSLTEVSSAFWCILF